MGLKVNPRWYRAVVDGVMRWNLDVDGLLSDFLVVDRESVDGVLGAILDAVTADGTRVDMMEDAPARMATSLEAAVAALAEAKHIIPKRIPPAATQQERLRQQSGEQESSDGLTILLYLLMRDALPVGTVAGLVRSATEDKGAGSLFTNGFLAQYARFLSNELKQVHVPVENPEARLYQAWTEVGGGVGRMIASASASMLETGKMTEEALLEFCRLLEEELAKTIKSGALPGAPRG